MFSNVSSGELYFVEKALSNNMRLDGRESSTTHRKIEIVENYNDEGDSMLIAHTDASACVTIGEAKVLCTLRQLQENITERDDAEVLDQNTDNDLERTEIANEKKLMLRLSLPPLDAFERDKRLYEAVISMISRELVTGGKTFLAGITVLADGAEFCECVSIGLFLCLKRIGVDALKTPIITAVYLISDKWVVDPSRQEAVAAEATLYVAVTHDGRITAMEKTGTGVFTKEEFSKGLTAAKESASKIWTELLSQQ